VLPGGEHGLGHLLNPTDPDSDDRAWVRQAWAYLLALESDPDAPGPEWLNRPAVGRTTISSPELHRLFEKFQAGGITYAESVKPFNFLNVAYVAPFERPEGTDRIVLVAPYETDPRRWLTLRWYNRYDGTPYRITTEPTRGRATTGTVRIKTFRDVLAEYRGHPEDKSLGPDGKPCRRRTRGLLQHRLVVARSITHIGKESNRLEDLRAGLDKADETLNEFREAGHDEWTTIVLRVLHDLGVREVARRTGFSPSSVQQVCTGASTPRPQNRAVYLQIAAEHARVSLLTIGKQPPRDPISCMSIFLRIRH
jgi:hypothetical protein